ncbi:DoxX family protein [Pendulispora rubella]|uniref:DoxX family protein n=1 Tax=Pendulispora rubella TaxID=2741070 RepID=A0ABZ2KV75_9BACT
MSSLLGKLPWIARLLAGVIFTLFGLNGFLHFLPMPPSQGNAAQFLGGLAAAPYFYPLLFLTELAGGVLLLAGRFVPLALLLLAPVIVNIVGFHLSAAPAGLPLALLVLALELFLAWSYRDSFAPVIRARAIPISRERPRPPEVVEPIKEGIIA